LSSLNELQNSSEGGVWERAGCFLKHTPATIELFILHLLLLKSHIKPIDGILKAVPTIRH